MRDWKYVHVNDPLEADEWADLLFDLEHSDPDSKSEARNALAERLARMEKATEPPAHW